jgi:hypothetical protein
LKKLPKEKNRPIGENSPNLVTLFVSNGKISSPPLCRNVLADFKSFERKDFDAGLPDGLFSTQNSKFRKILEGLAN